MPAPALLTILRPMPLESTLICIHGYGVRGFFWEEFAKIAKVHFNTVICPDLCMQTLESTIIEIQEICRHAAANGNTVTLIGHSLGAILCALAAQNLNPSILRALVVIACPFGERKRQMPPFVRFLLFHKLIPDFLLRRRFFGPQVPLSIQKAIFAQAIKENPEFQQLISTGTWFHNNLIKPLPEITTLAISSSADQIVASSETRAMATALNCEYIDFPKSQKVGHDDFGVSPFAAQLILETLRHSAIL